MFEIFDQEKKAARKIYLTLERCDGGGIVLRAVYEDGSYVSCGSILRIQEDGTLTRCYGVSCEIGLKVEDAKIKLAS